MDQKELVCEAALHVAEIQPVMAAALAVVGMRYGPRLNRSSL
jgi:hypothetical protein